MVVIVSGSAFVARRRAVRPYAPNQTLVDQDGEGVVDRLTGNDTYLGADGPGDVIRGDVRFPCHRCKNGEALGRDLNTVSTQEIGRVVKHCENVRPILD
jgi:hypothetical protein